MGLEPPARRQEQPRALTPLRGRRQRTAARARLKAERAGLAFLETARAEDAIARLEHGIRISAAMPPAAESGRRHTKRALLW
jgi:hypothetical protein